MAFWLPHNPNAHTRRIGALRVQAAFRCTYTVAMILVCATCVLAQSDYVTATDKKAQTAVHAARRALGGDKPLKTLNALTLIGTARARQPNGTFMTYTYEVRLMLPGHILWITRFPGNIVRYTGISGNELRSAMLIGGARAHSAPIDHKDRNELAARLDATARLLIGMIMKASSRTPLTISTSQKHHTNNEYTVSKAEGALCAIEFDQKERHPSILRYKDTVQAPPEAKRDPSTNNVRVTLSPRMERIDAIMRFTNRAPVDGIMFPRTITYESRGVVDRELTVERVLVNPTLSLKDFELPQ